MARNIDDAPDDVRENVKRAIRNGKVEFSDQVRQQMLERGVSEEDVLAMLMNSVGLDS